MEDIIETIQVKKLDKDFKNQIMKEPVGDKLTRCFACGICSASCPVRAIDEEFNPRKIIRMCVLGMKEVVVKSDFIWLCTSCYMCQERCPQDVMITELMSAIKKVAVSEGIIHPSYVAQGQALRQFNRLYEIGEFENKGRITNWSGTFYRKQYSWGKSPLHPEYRFFGERGLGY